MEKLFEMKQFKEDVRSLLSELESWNVFFIKILSLKGSFLGVCVVFYWMKIILGINLMIYEFCVSFF